MMGGETGKKKPDPRVIINLHSDDEKLILRQVRNLRSAGNLHYLPELLKVLGKTDNEIVKKELVRFLADIKDSAALPYFLSGLTDPELAGIRDSIVSACWQSGMDYSANISLFISLFLEGNYSTALESFTVIEESLENMNREDIEKARNQVLDGLDLLSAEKKPLAMELVKILQV